ncbi:7TM diverse intracellular signaling domain-containing protein [Pseudopedobacter sp.]|uniref:7TM diverse intracellular signaling domain-containing protein n=1 Tax=Pseudopedobacter sp. TaxID=1936787 RepID=UPI003341EBCA
MFCIRWLIYLVCIITISGKLYAQPIDVSSVPDLKFSTIYGKDDLSAAEDKLGNSWIKGLIPSSLLPGPVIFQISSMQVADYDMYLQQGDQLIQMQRNIDLKGHSIQTRYPVYYFTARDSVYYLNIKKQPVQRIKITVDEPGRFVKQANINFMVNSLYYGLAIMSIIFNVVLYLIFRDKRFWLYSLLQLSLFLIFFYQDGMFYFFTKGHWVNPHFLLWNIAICAVISGIFAYYFLDLKNKVPRFKQIAIPIICAIFFTVLIYTWTDIQLFRTLASVLFYLLPAICIYHGIKMFRDDVYARFLILSFGFIALVSVFYTLNNYIDSPFLSFFGMDMIRFASTLEIISISFAIIYKVRALQHENERYREELNRYLRELEELKDVGHTFPKSGIQEKTNGNVEIMQEMRLLYNLTERETEVLMCIFNRLTNQEISEKLFISLSTTKYHVSNLYLKLDVKNRKEIQQVFYSQV